MPRKTTKSEKPDDPKPASINRDKAEKYVSAWESLDAKIDKALAQAAKDVQPFKDDQKAIVKRAAENGIPKAEFKAVLRERKLRRKADAVRGSLNKNQQETYDVLKVALGMQLDLFNAEQAPKSRRAKSKAKGTPASEDKPEEPEAEAQTSFAAEQMAQLQQ